MTNSDPITRDLSDPEMVTVLREDGTVDPQVAPEVAMPEIIGLYKAMARTRLVDERLVLIQRQGRIGFHIGSLGEEAAIIGSAAALRDKDFIFPCYREFGAALLRGMPLQRYVDNMFGNANDPARGRQMPDHYTWQPGHFGSVSSPIGTQIAHAAGFAWAAKLRGDELVALAYFGEGATSSNDFHNGMNFAGVFKAPAIMLCRNNGWAISIPTDRQTASGTFAEKGQAYGVRYARCDGNDVLAVYACTKDARERALRGEGPTMIEAVTYRMSGHSTSDDPTAYRIADELDPWRRRDPIERLRRYLVANQAWDDASQSALELEVDTEIKQAIAAAERTKVPELGTMFDDVYARLPWHLEEQRTHLCDGPRAPKAHHHSPA